MNIRNANEADLEEIMNIYEIAQDFMIKNGNTTQWGKNYPDRNLVISDIKDNKCKVLYDDTGIHGVFALFDDLDPTYIKIENGSWLNDEPYLTIHRIASDGKVHGVFECASTFCKQISNNIRIDTHHNNLIMQGLMEKNGFVKCGIIYVFDGTPRIAYQWNNNSNE